MNRIPRMPIKLLFPHVPMLFDSQIYLELALIAKYHCTKPGHHEYSYDNSIHGRDSLEIGDEDSFKLVITYHKVLAKVVAEKKNIRKRNYENTQLLFDRDVGLQLLPMRISCFVFIATSGIA